MLRISRLLTALVVLVFLSALIQAQEPPIENLQGKDNTSIDAILKTLVADTFLREKELAGEVERLRIEAVKSLEVVARNAVTRGDASMAAKAWKEILRIDATHKSARDFFETFGNLQVILKEVANKKTASPRRSEWSFVASKQVPVPFVKFREVNEKEWVECDSSGKNQFTFQKVVDTVDFIELIDVSRKMRVRVHASIFYVQTDAISKNHWESSTGTGNWTN